MLGSRQDPVIAETIFMAEVPAEILTPEEVDGLNHFDWIWMGTQLDAWTERWNKALAA